jgi:hypothetical protein
MIGYSKTNQCFSFSVLALGEELLEELRHIEAYCGMFLMQCHSYMTKPNSAAWWGEESRGQHLSAIFSTGKGRIPYKVY